MARGNNGEAEPEECDGRDQVVRQLPRVERVLPSQRRGHGQRQPQDNVFQHRYAQHQAREPGVKDFQVGKNLGNHRDRSYRHPDRENDDQRNAVAVGAGERGADEPGTERQPKDKRYSRAHDGQPTHFAALFAGKQLAGLGAGKEHQQEQAEPVHEIQNICLLPDGVHQARRPGQSANQRGAQHHAREDLAHYLRLPESDKKVAEQLRQPDQGQEYEENRGQIRVGHGRRTLPGSLRCLQREKVCRGAGLSVIT